MVGVYAIEDLLSTKSLGDGQRMRRRLSVRIGRGKRSHNGRTQTALVDNMRVNLSAGLVFSVGQVFCRWRHFIAAEIKVVLSVDAYVLP